MLIAMLLATGCRHLPIEEEAEGQGTLMLQIRTGEVSTKAGSPSGDKFHNVLIVVANNNGHVVDKKYKEYPDDEPTNNDNLWFQGLKVGYYQVYAYANIKATDTDWLDPGQSIYDIERRIRSDKDDPNDDSLLDQPLNPDRQFRQLSLTGTDTPAALSDDNWMLMTGHDELYVGVDICIGQVDLYKPVVKFNVVLDNHTEFDVTLTQLYFNNFNASDSYLIGRVSENGDPIIPSENMYRAMPSLEAPVIVESGEKVTVFPKLLYENQFGQDYRMFATLQLTDSQNHLREEVLTSQSVRRIPYSEIANMQNGDELTVLAVTPNTTNGAFIGFRSGEGLKYQTAAFNFEEGYRYSAEEVLANSQINSTFTLTLSKDASGLYHLKQTASGKDLFETVDGKNCNGLTLVEVQKGEMPASDHYPISSEFIGSLCRFTYNGSSLFFNNGQLKLSTDISYGNRMWAFYEIHPEGTVLKIIDQQTSRVSTLTRMIRGQELTAVMNVYFEDVDDMFKFDVDNMYWAETPHNSSHLFK